MTYLFPGPKDPVHGYPTKLAGFTIAEGSGAKAQFPICCVEPFLVSSRVMFRYHDGHDGVLVDEDVE